MIIEYLFYIFLVATVIQLLYHLLIFIRIWFYKEFEYVNYKPVSVISHSINLSDRYAFGFIGIYSSFLFAIYCILEDV